MKRHWFKEFYLALVSTENIFAHIFLLTIRFYWGYLLFMIGLSKLGDVTQTIHGFTNMNVPYPSLSAWLAGIIEILGGLSLCLGLFARVMSLVLIAFFLAAYGLAHQDAIASLLSTPSEFIQASPFLFLLTSLIVFSFGSGSISFDHWIERKIFGRSL